MRLMDPKIFFELERMVTRARIDMRSKPDVEYTGKHGGGDVESYTCDER